MEMKLCIDCKHIITESKQSARYSQCRRAKRQNPVDGKLTYLYCEGMRAPGQPCGTDPATLFEEKE